VSMSRNLTHRKRDLFGASSLGQGETVAKVNGKTTTQVRQGES